MVHGVVENTEGSTGDWSRGAVSRGHLAQDTPQNSDNSDTNKQDICVAFVCAGLTFPSILSRPSSTPVSLTRLANRTTGVQYLAMEAEMCEKREST